MLDRSPCLSAMPVKMFPMGHPIGIMGIRSPGPLRVTMCQSKNGPCETQTIKPSESLAEESKVLTKAFSVEISIKAEKKKKKKQKQKKKAISCADSPEDVLFALFLLGTN